jgi:YesN/AraC family two-component response regulator
VDFSAIKLAELTESKYNYVSQVINENFGCNFNAVLNEYRIKEACNRMNDISNYGNYTIEAIANSVGYSSTKFFPRRLPQIHWSVTVGVSEDCTRQEPKKDKE